MVLATKFGQIGEPAMRANRRSHLLDTAAKEKRITT